MRTFAVALTCAALLLCGLLPQTARAQSADELRKWAEDARQRMNDEFQKLRSDLDRQRQTMEERLNKLQSDLQKRLDDILGGGNSTPPSTPAPQATGNAYLGVQVGAIDDGMRTLLDIPAGQGVLVREVVANSPAAKSLKTYDVILGADGKKIATAADLQAAVAAHKPGETMKLEILRESKKQNVDVVVGNATRNGNNNATPNETPADPNDLRGMLDRAFGEGAVPDPQAENGNPFGGANPFGGGEGQNPFGGEGMQQLQERMQELFQNPERMQGMMERLREMLGGGGQPNPNDPNGGQNPLGGQLEDFLRGLEGGNGNQAQPANPPATEARPWLGLTATNPDEAMQAAGAKGVVVTAVADGGPAAAAGIQRGDLIVSFAGQDVTDKDSLKAALDMCNVGMNVQIKVSREGKVIDLEMTLKGRN